MTVFPIEIMRTDLVHEGGTKEYHVVLIKGGKGSVVINRWGKRGDWGTVTQKSYWHHSDAAMDYSRKIREKEGRGYVKENFGPNDVCYDEADFKADIGLYYRELNNSALTTLGLLNKTNDFVSIEEVAPLPDEVFGLSKRTPAEIYAADKEWGEF
jgi:predicted DNA-binding WGR domain protein